MARYTGSLHAVVPAAGIGSRMQSTIPKQFISINGLSVLSHTIERLLHVESLCSIVVVVDESTYSEQKIAFDHPNIAICVGGATRAESVRNGLQHLAAVTEPDSQVLVHDAARPCVRVADIYRLIDEVAGDKHGGLLAMPVTDTIKRSDGNQQLLETVDRDQLWRAATPQLFSIVLLLQALNDSLSNAAAITDEASAMQLAGYRPKLVQCSADNIKVTTPTDIALAEHYLNAQQFESPTDKQTEGGS